MSADRRLDGFVSIVTGAGHGIGRSYAHGLAARGSAVVVADLDGEAAAKVAGEIEGDGGQALASSTDVASWDAVQNMAADCIGAFGRIDVLVNNAAIFATVPVSRGSLDEIDPQEWDRVMDVNVKGVWLAVRSVTPQMRRQRFGKVVNISSGTALKGSSGRGHYVASKAAVLGLTRTMARELGKDGICVNAVAPGSTLSEDAIDDEVLARRQDAVGSRALARVQRPDDLVGAIAFFASHDSDFITGQTLVVDGGSYMH